jgi:metal-responsive CopG/Arc/MetJ family transcriptional regulator
VSDVEELVSYRQDIVVISFKIDAPLLHQLQKYAIKHRISRSEAIRRGITMMLKEAEDTPRTELHF